MGALLYSRPARSTDDKVGGGRLVRAESLPSGGCANPAWHPIELTVGTELCGKNHVSGLRSVSTSSIEGKQK